MSKPTAAAPRVSRHVLSWFRWYIRRYLRKSFNTVGIAEPLPPALATALEDKKSAIVVYLNHASWWDPLVSMHLAERLMPGWTLYAPFDAEALSRYPIFEKLGFFGVDQESRRGAAQFLRTSRAVFDTLGGSIWMTPEGRFVDPRQTDADFRPGLAHLVEHLARDGREGYVLPLAIEYPFWEEKNPEALCRFGEPIVLTEHKDLDKAAWDALLEERLRSTQRELAAQSIARDTSAFRVLIGGEAGVGGVYEPIRWLHAKLTGKTYRAAHSEKWAD